MQQLISSLLSIEDLARDVYVAAAKHFAEDRPFSLFLGSLARDEVVHAATLKRAIGIVDHMSNQPAQAFEFGAERLPRMRDRVCDILEQIRAGTLEKQEMIVCVLELEMSEWNDFFLYVVDVLKGQDREFQHMASSMQSHKEEVVRFCRTYSDTTPLSHQLSEAPAVWTRKTLVVDDEPAITSMLIRVLKKRVDVEVASDGKEALERVRDSYYDAIISDMDMPGVSGLQFLQSASAIDRSIKERFLFLTAGLSEENVRFLTANHIRFLYKPAAVESIRDMLDEILGDEA
jgi:CheY-like chemotaxis protein